MKLLRVLGLLLAFTLLACETPDPNPCTPLLVNPFPQESGQLGVNTQQLTQQLTQQAVLDSRCASQMIQCSGGAISFGGMPCPTIVGPSPTCDPNATGFINGCTFTPTDPTRKVGSAASFDKAEACDLAGVDLRWMCDNELCSEMCERELDCSCICVSPAIGPIGLESELACVCQKVGFACAPDPT